MAPDGKATLQVLQLQQKVDAATQKFDIAQMNDQMKLQVASQLDAGKVQVTQLIQQGADKRAADSLQEKLDALQAQIKAKHEDVKTVTQSKEKIAAAGVAAKKELATSQQLSPQSTAFYAQSLRAGNYAAVSEVLGMSRNRAGIMDQIIKEAQEQDPEFDGKKAAGALAEFGGTKAGAQVVGRTDASVTVGADELKRYIPAIEPLIKKVNTSEYPTINSVMQAAEKGAGGADVVQLRNMVHGARNAYQQIAARGGRMTVFNAQQAQDLISGNMPLDQFEGAAKALIKEAEINKGATGQAMKDVTGQGDDAGGTMVTDARKVAKLKAGDSKAYEQARDKYLTRYKAHGGEDALRKALKDGDTDGTSAIPDGAPTASDAQGNKVYWDGSDWKPALKDGQ